jgi:hypothetical protein
MRAAIYHYQTTTFNHPSLLALRRHSTRAKLEAERIYCHVKRDVVVVGLCEFFELAPYNLTWYTLGSCPSTVFSERDLELGFYGKKLQKNLRKERL